MGPVLQALAALRHKTDQQGSIEKTDHKSSPVKLHSLFSEDNQEKQPRIKAPVAQDRKRILWQQLNQYPGRTPYQCRGHGRQYSSYMLISHTIRYYKSPFPSETGIYSRLILRLRSVQASFTPADSRLPSHVSRLTFHFSLFTLHFSLIFAFP